MAKSNGRIPHDRSPFAGLPDPIAMDQMARAVENAATSRSLYLRRFLDPRRDLNDECGYPETGAIGAKDLRDMYDRDPVAERVVGLMPDECWSVWPEVYEDEDEDVTTPFEEAWGKLPSTMRGQSWYEGEEGSPIWEMLRRADRLCGIGTYGILLIGLDDGMDLREPVQGKGGRKLLFMRAFDESMVQVTRYNTDITNPRYGQPEEYMVTFYDPNEQSKGGIGLPMASRMVHWSRVIHLADNLGSSEVFGAPRLRPVLNRIMDLQKLYSGSAEMYWRGAFHGLSLETHPQLGGDVTIDTDDIKDSMEQYMNGLQRYLVTSGMSVKPLSPTIADPTGQINAHIDAICIQLGVPKRIFMGSERGELASSQDEGTWNDRLRDRQNGFITPRIVVPFVDRLIQMGVLPQPEQYSVVWPDLEALSEQEQATLAVTRTDAIVKYVQGGAEGLIVPHDWMTRVLGLTSDEADEVLESAEEHQAEMEEEKQAQAEEQQAAQIEMMKQQAALQPQAIPGQPAAKGNVPPQFQKKPPTGAAAAVTTAAAITKKKEAGKPKPPFLRNAFCATGEGGGIDPSCGKGEGGGERKKTGDYKKADKEDIRDAREVLLSYAEDNSNGLLGPEGKEFDGKDVFAAALKHASIVKIPIKDLEPESFPDHDPVSTSKPIIVVEYYNGERLLADGNQRFYTAKEAGQKTIKALLVKLKDAHV